MSTQTRQIRDSWLALRCQNGEREAFELVIKELEHPLHYFVQKMVGRGDHAQIAVANAAGFDGDFHLIGTQRPGFMTKRLERLARRDRRESTKWHSLNSSFFQGATNDPPPSPGGSLVF